MDPSHYQESTQRKRETIFDDLRQRAERTLSGQHPQDPPGDHDIMALIHELDVHQIELELQNEELRNAQFDLEAARDRFVDLYDLAPVGYVSLSPEGKIIEANLTSADMFGMERSSFLNGTLTSFVLPEFLIEFRDHLHAAEDRDSIRTFDIGFRRSDGSTFYGNISTVDVFDENDVLLHSRVTITDITKRILSEKATARSERQWETTFGSISDWVSIIDPATHRITRSNDSVLRLLGIPKSEILGKPCCEVVHGTSIPHPECPLNLTLTSGRTTTIEMELPERKTWLQITTDPIFDEAGRISSIVHVVHDITHLKEVEHDIQISLEEKTVLLREVHHRVKNDLQIISSLLDLQSDTIDNEEFRGVFQECRHRVKSMALVHEKLHSSDNLVNLVVSEYVRDLIETLVDSYISTDQDIIFTYNIDDIRLNIDTAIPLGLMINELVSNCIKHAFPPSREGERNEITIEIRTQEDGTYQLTVRDNGVGFPDLYDQATTQTLGLQLVTMLAQQLHGTMESKIKNGTEFIVTFKPRNDSIIRTP
jgi:PAS domain S-box-containing protein